jgi:hypothetical protein
MGSIYKEPRPPLSFEESSTPWGRSKNGAELARFTFREPHPEVDMKFQPMFDVAVGERPNPGSLELREAVAYVETKVLPRLYPCSSS